jgi:hypothetical protein
VPGHPGERSDPAASRMGRVLFQAQHAAHARQQESTATIQPVPESIPLQNATPLMCADITAPGDLEMPPNQSPYLDRRKRQSVA